MDLKKKKFSRFLLSKYQHYNTKYCGFEIYLKSLNYIETKIAAINTVTIENGGFGFIGTVYQQYKIVFTACLRAVYFHIKSVRLWLKDSYDRTFVLLP